MSEAASPPPKAVCTDHPVLTEFRAVFVELLGTVPRELVAEIEDDPERDVMKVEIRGAFVRGPFTVKFEAVNQGKMSEEAWGVHLRHLMRTWLRMRMAGQAVYVRKERRR